VTAAAGGEWARVGVGEEEGMRERSREVGR
jgi:hypothetical protein